MWIILTVVVFLIARKIAVKANHPLVNPLLISIAVIIPLLTYLKVPFDTYYADNEVFSFLLQPAVVALAYPLYEQLPQIKANWRIIFFACGSGQRDVNDDDDLDCRGIPYRA